LWGRVGEGGPSRRTSCVRQQPPPPPTPPHKGEGSALSSRHRYALAAKERALALIAALGLALAGCSSSLLSIGAPPGALPGGPKQAQQQQQPPVPTQREHQRILAAYNGAYDDPKLEGLLNQAVAKLVAASDRPDVAYRVTILNSAAVNAFALPTGQLYVTRGLIALANDTSELASVLSHEMSHVIARHAAMREDQARQVALVSRVVQDVLSDPETGALALAKSKIALASFSRAQEFEADGIGVGIAARAGYDPYGAVRFLTSMGRNSELKAPPGQTRIDPRAADFHHLLADIDAGDVGIGVARCRDRNAGCAGGHVEDPFGIAQHDVPQKLLPPAAVLPE